ncbi:MAG: PCP reductase family protein, partial [Nitrospirota bacterium]|nr:PCP reductase family protein [Nitrospirota bacterium]
IGVARMHDEKDIKWTDEAEERLQRLPFFLRGMIKGNVERYAKEHGISPITPGLLDELKKRRFGDKAPDMPFVTGSGRETQSQEILHSGNMECNDSSRCKEPVREGKENQETLLPWTKEAMRRLDAIPEFMRSIFKEAAEELARDKGHLEVNLEVWNRLEEAAGSGTEAEMQSQETLHSGQEIKWTEDVLMELEERYADKPGFAREFMVAIMKEDIERWAVSRGIALIDKNVLEASEEREKVKAEWTEEAWQRLQKAPDFIRSGIKKAAERRAARTGVSLITSELLTQFRNMAMMKAVKRIKALGFTELSFDAFDHAKENFKHIRENKEAQERFDAIRAYGTSKGEIGLIDEDMLEKMKEYLKR